MKTKIPTFIVFSLLCFRFLPETQAVNPPPPGGYPNFTTAAGDHALQALTLGLGNTAIGTYSMFSVTTGNFNTAVGAGALDLNTADSNTATGAAALLFNTTGNQNTANGTAALELNSTGSSNTANGAFALFGNTVGSTNTASGTYALYANTTGHDNTANGSSALVANIDGSLNTAVGVAALAVNTTGSENTALGGTALDSNTTGSANTAIGRAAGFLIATGSGNVCIGQNVLGAAGAINTTWIRNVYNSAATARQVYVNADDKIGTLSSSRRYKEQIAPMNKASETLFALKPVTFRYKKDVDPGQALSFGLIAEDVAQVSAELVTPDEQGKPQTVRYEAVNAMLLNEFLKEHRKNQQQETTIAELKKEIAGLVATVKAQTAQIQKVNARLELNDTAPQMANYEE
jgi:hypothetical protein